MTGLAGAQIWHPAFQVDVAGTTGAGDAAYAGLLAALMRGLEPEACARMACAVAACNIEAADATTRRTQLASDRSQNRRRMGYAPIAAHKVPYDHAPPMPPPPIPICRGDSWVVLTLKYVYGRAGGSPPQYLRHALS